MSPSAPIVNIAKLQSPVIVNGVELVPHPYIPNSPVPLPTYDPNPVPKSSCISFMDLILPFVRLGRSLRSTSTVPLFDMIPLISKDSVRFEFLTSTPEVIVEFITFTVPKPAVFGELSVPDTVTVPVTVDPVISTEEGVDICDSPFFIVMAFVFSLSILTLENVPDRSTPFPSDLVVVVVKFTFFTLSGIVETICER